MLRFASILLEVFDWLARSREALPGRPAPKHTHLVRGAWRLLSQHVCKRRFCFVGGSQGGATVQYSGVGGVGGFATESALEARAHSPVVFSGVQWRSVVLSGLSVAPSGFWWC